MPLPTQSDFGDISELDIGYAWKMFGGKTADEAYDLFRENAFSRQEDLMWMGAHAFIYYFPAAAKYLMSSDASGDSDGVSSIASLLDYRLEHDLDSIRPVSEVVITLCDYVVKNLPMYEANEEIYGNLKARYEEIKNRTKRSR
ncbi:MAG TPA: hypothetical protein VIS96_06535 [Terrimicrobiaceae bacterium]